MQWQRAAYRKDWRGPGPLFLPAQHQSSRVWQQLFCFYSQNHSFPFPVHCNLMRLTGDKLMTQDWPVRNPILLVWFVQDEQVDWKDTQRNTTSVDPQGLHLRDTQRSSWPRNQAGVSCTAGRFFTLWATGEPYTTWELNFVWGKMRPAAWRQHLRWTALRALSKEATGKGQYI